MFNKIFVLMIAIALIMIPLVDSAPPIFEIDSTEGFSIEPTTVNYIKTGEDHEFEIHVFNKTNGAYILDGISCYAHLYNDTGRHQLELEDSTPSHFFDYSFDIAGGNFTRGCYQIKFQCNESSDLSGGSEMFFCANDYGLELTDSETWTFGFGISMLFIFLIIAVIGIFAVDHFIGKFALYWVAHVLIVLITFSAWQFTQGFVIGYIGIAGIFKILFYVTITAMLPMVLVSVAWIVWIVTVTDEMKDMLERGSTPEEAYGRTRSRRFFGLKW